MSDGNSITVKDRVWWVSPRALVPCELNPRKRFDRMKLVEMADSIARYGVQQPLKSRPVLLEGEVVADLEDLEFGGNGSLEVIYGERRWRGSMMVLEGYTDAEGVEHEARPDLRIPVMVDRLDNEAVFELMMLENLAREDLAPSEEGRGYAYMVERFELSSRQVAAKLGVPRKRVDRFLSLLDLPENDLLRLDEGELPQYAALEALRVPAEWRGGEARMEALSLAEQAGNPSRAHELIEARFLRPARERARWESEEFRDDLRERWGSEVEFLEYGVCRELFPPGTSSLTAVTAGSYVLADLVPEPPEVHGYMDESWGDLAAKYGAPLFVACDGGMNGVRLVRKDLVADAARVAHMMEVVVEPVEGDVDFRFVPVEGGSAPEVGAEVAFVVLSHGGVLPSPVRSGVVYFVAQVDGDEGFHLSISPGGETLLLDDGGRGTEDHPLRVAVLDLSACPFLPVEGRLAVEVARVEGAAESKEDEEALREKAARAGQMVGDLELAIRAEVSKGNGSDGLLAKAGRFLVVAGVVGFEGNDSPAIHLMLALEKPEEEREMFSSWEGVGEDRAGFESFVVCAWVLYMLDQYEGEDLRDCPQWKEVAAVYGV
jgi:ParB-like chromosome segregation protein Spo0J